MSNNINDLNNSLIAAVRDKKIEGIRILIRNGADVNVLTDNDIVALKDCSDPGLFDYILKLRQNKAAALNASTEAGRSLVNNYALVTNTLQIWINQLQEFVSTSEKNKAEISSLINNGAMVSQLVKPYDDLVQQFDEYASLMRQAISKMEDSVIEVRRTYSDSSGANIMSNFDTDIK